MARFHWRFFLLRWHRRLGIVSALFVLLLAVTGILLNHSHEFGLDGAPLESPWLRQHYGVAAPAGLTHALPAGELSVRGGWLRLGERNLGSCPQLVGVVEQAGQVLAVCSDRLILLTPAGELIDQADAVRGIPEGLSAIGRQRDQVLLRQGESSFAVDLNDLSVRPARPEPGVAWTGAAAAADTADLDWEQVLLDLHSGRLFGRWGVLLMDAMAILFVILALSGLVMARRRPRTSRAG